MEKFTSTLYANMTEQLDQLVFSTDNILKRAERSYRVVEHTLEELKEYIIDYTFKDKQEEIKFFKEIKPMFLRELLYFMEVFQVESWKPPVGKADEITHYMIGAKRVDLYFKTNNELYNYYRTGSSIHDQQYFLRNQESAEFIAPISTTDLDPQFSTFHSIQFATIQAYEQFATYLEQCIYRIEHPEAVKAAEEREAHTTAWTDPKVDLIEMGYGIFVRGSVNNGKASLKQIMKMLGKMFNVDLGNYAVVIQQNIRLRKRKSRMHYLSSVIESSERRMDDLDANPIRG